MSTETAVRYASECCDEYNTYTTLSEEFRVVFRFTHTSTFELIPVASAYQSLGDSWWKNPAFSVLPWLTSGDFYSNLEKRLFPLPNIGH